MDVQEAELASLQAQLTVALEDNATVADAQARVHDTAALLSDLTLSGRPSWLTWTPSW
ncbi:MAG: hypothetical protein WBG36_06055 [Ornithinimicrobium sp.]